MSLGDTLSRDFGGDDLPRKEVNSISRALRFRLYLEDARLCSKASQRAARGHGSITDVWLSLLGRRVSCCRGVPHC